METKLNEYTNQELIEELKQRMDQNRQEQQKTIPQEKPQYPAICSLCGKATTVPFKPTGHGTIKCRECYLKTR